MNLMCNNKMLIKFLAIATVVVVLLCNFCIPQNVVYAKSVKDWQSELDSLSKEADKLRDKMNSLDSRKEDQQAYSELLQKQVFAFEGSIKSLDNSIKQINNEINALQKQIEDNIDKFEKRLKSIYMTDKMSILTSILNNESFSKYIIHMDAMKRVAENDNKLIKELTAKKQQVLDKKNEVLKQKIDVDNKKIELQKKKKESDHIIQELLQQKDKTKEEIMQLSREMANASKAIEELIQAESSDGEFVGGRYGYPVPGHYRISSTYGHRDIQGIDDFHTGIDFPAPKGTPVVAANTGRIIAIKTSGAGYKGGYGMHIIIDHGGKQSTLYGHMSSFANVSVGDVVIRGQTIGFVGSTGWSTGNHLHFEVRLNGRHTNPLPYLTS